MQQYVHFPVSVMMSMPIPYGVMQGSPNTSNSPQLQMNGSSNSSPRQQIYPANGGEMYPSNNSNQAPGRQSKNRSSSAKKKDSSIEIIESPPSPFSSSQEKPKGKKQQGGYKSKISKKAEKKLALKRDQNSRVQEEQVSSTSLGARVRSKQDKVQNSQGGLSTPLQAASTPQKRTTRNSSGGSRSPDQEHKFNQNYQTYSHQQKPNHNYLNKQFQPLPQQPLEVIIDSDNSNSTEIHECILVEDSVEEITNQKFKNQKSNKRCSDEQKKENDKKDIIKKQKEQQYHHNQHQEQFVQSIQQKNEHNNGYQQNFAQQKQSVGSYPPPLYYCSYYQYSNNDNFQNAFHGAFITAQQPYPNSQLSRQQDQICNENQYHSPHKQSSIQAQTKRAQSPKVQVLPGSGQSQVSTKVAAAARTKSSLTKNNVNEIQQKQSLQSSNRKFSQSPQNQHKANSSPLSHCIESESEDNNGYLNHNTQVVAKRNQGSINNRNSTQDNSQEDKSKRTRKHNTFYNNGDFISGEYMFISKKLTNKRSNPIQMNPILKKKYQKNSNENISSSKSLQAQMMEIITQNQSDKSTSLKIKNLFIQSVKPSEIARAAQNAAKNAFTLPLKKRNPQRKISDDVHKGSAYFPNDPKQNLIEEKFDEQTIFLVNNNNQNVEIKVKKTPLDKSAICDFKKPNKEEQQIIDPLEKIVNKFDVNSRSKYFQQIQFIKDYKSGYTPIDIQNQQEKELDEMEKNEQQVEETHKQHFIRRKQTNNINLKRSCGVSYVKQPESKQENVSQIYERLPQLVFQCSNGQPKLIEHENFYEKLYYKIFTSQNQWLLCTYFESEDESLMRDYLLYPEQRWELCKGKYFIVRSVNDIWPLFIEKYFLCIHLFFDSKELIKCPQIRDFSFEEVKNIIKYSNIHLGLLFKRSINGKKAFKKSLGNAFMGEIENHPSSRQPKEPKKKGKKPKNAITEVPIVEEKDNKKDEDSKRKDSDQQQNSQFYMSKPSINKFFKEVKNKLNQDKFLNQLPIFKKKIEEIQKYLLPYMKKLNSQEGVMPSEEVIKSISELDTNEEKVEALLEMMDFIQEQINDEDYEIRQPQKEISKKVSTRKDSLKKSNTNTPAQNPIPSENNNETFTQLLLSKDSNQNEKNSSEIDIEVESDSKIQDPLPNKEEKVQISEISEQKDQSIEIEKDIQSSEVKADQQKNEENEIQEEKIKSESEEKQKLSQDIIEKEEKIEVEESQEEPKLQENKETTEGGDQDKDKNEENSMIVEEEKVEVKENNVELIEIEKDNQSESSSSEVSSPKQQSILKQIENIQSNYQEVNQNAQNFEKLETLNNESQRISYNSPVREATSQSSSHKFIHSPSHTISKDLLAIERAQNNQESTAIIAEENTVPIPNQTNTNQNQNDKKESNTDTQLTKEIRKESLICQEILNYIDKDISSKNINTLSAKQILFLIQNNNNHFISSLNFRLELYVEEKGWKNSSQLVKSLLSTFTLYVKEQFEKLALEMMNIRFGIARDENEAKLSETLKNVRLITKYSTKRRQTYENYSYHTRGKWDFNENNLSLQNIENNLFNKKELKINEDKLLNETEPITIPKLIDKEEGYSILKRGDLSMPLYYISTRDSFAFDLLEKISTCHFNGKTFTKTEYFFDPENHPTNFKSFIDMFPDYRVGATLYTGFFTHEELLSIEDSCYETEVKSFQRHYFPMTAQMTCTVQKIRRTKFFFGSRYIWTRQQLAEPHSFVGAGVRQDVSQPPAWMRRKVVSPLEQAGILPNGFINSLALNVYHDGKEGLAQHFDDATRFRQPIFTFKLFSDARLSFGSQLYGFCNSAFVIPMPRGSVLKLEENSYAANGIKHCVRPCDMAGKNATIIMRQMHHKVVSEAITYDENVDLPTWISTLSSKEDAIPYGDQKEIEADFLMRNSGQNCS